MKKKRIILKGLNCADCASKIESGIKSLEGIKKVNLNFSSSIMSIEVEKLEDWKAIYEDINKVVKKYEPDVDILENRQDGHSHDHNIIHQPGGYGRRFSKEDIFIILGIIVFIISIVFRPGNPAKLILFTISYLLIGGEILLRAGKNILSGQIFDENFLMAIATLGAFAIGEYPEAVAVMLFYQVGEFFQDLAVNRSRKSIQDLMDIRPDYANLKIGDNIREVSPYNVNIGDTIIIKPGEKVPLDGEVVEGASMVDTSALTGESVPRSIKLGDEVLGGFINTSGLISLKVTKSFQESTVSKILELVENTSSNKANTEQFITKFSRYYTPFVVFIAIGLAIIPPLILNTGFSGWIYRSLVFLVISCPCALVISVPLGFFGGIGAASRNGVLVKGGNYLEALNSIDMMVFDKTGTLTKGNFDVVKIKTFNSFDHKEFLNIAAHGEYYSNHPIASSIIKKYDGFINKESISDYQEISGHGIKAIIKGKNVLLGNNKLMKKEGIDFEPSNDIGTIVYGAIDGDYLGYIVISDELKPDTKNTIKKLKSLGVRKTIMLTGDNKLIGESIAKELGLDDFYAELLPQNKVERLEILEKGKIKGKNLVFVGDGINDAPVLIRSDIGIAMGGLGSDAAIEAADIVLMTDEPSKIVKAINIAKFTRRIVVQNIVFALGVKAIILLLGALGYATMWAAVFADVGVSLIAILNSLRIINSKFKY